MASRRRPRRKRNGNNGNGRRNGNRRNGTTARQKIQTGGNGLSNQGALRRPLITRKFIESGSDFLGPLTVRHSPSSAADRILLSESVSPSAFPGTRLTQLSNLWERYRFRKFRLRWVPAVPKTIACQLIIYQDTDPLDDPTIIPDADALIRQATAQAGSQQFNFINAMSIDLAQRADDKLYYTGVDKQNERFNRQGTFYVIQVTDPLNFNGEPLPSDIMAGSIYVDWVCEFQVAQINPYAASPNCQHGTLELEPIATPIPDGNNQIGTIHFDDPTFLSTGQVYINPTAPSASSVLTVKIGTISIGSTLITPPRASGFSEQVSFEAGTHTVNIASIDSITLGAALTINWVNHSGTPPVFIHI